MAAAPYDSSLPGNSFAFEIYNDANSLRTPAPTLPGGPCNYTDQTLPRCGCRRFWSRALFSGGGFQDNAAANLAEVCMCSHHACFHEDVQPGQAQPGAMAANAGGQENQRPVTNREPLSPIQDFATLHMPPSFASLDFNRLDFQTSLSAPRMEAATPCQVEDARPGQDSPLPDTYNSWGDMIRTQAGHSNGLPPFPAQCLMSSQPPPSTASSSQARYLMPFAGKGLQTLSGARAHKPDALRLEQEDVDARVETIQEPPVTAPDSGSRGGSTPKATHSQTHSALSPESGTFQKLADRVETHEQRLDRIERASFSVAGHDDCHDRHEHVDLRVTELESRVEEVEKILNDNGSIAGSKRTARLDGAADDATASVVSVSTNATARASNRAEVYTQLQALQAQVEQLQAAALPSYTKPWDLEVVFLPFPLKGIWMSAREFPSQRRSIGSNVDEWTQMPNTISRSTPDPQSPKFQDWPGQGPESTWLLPRAFVAGRIIDQRLNSRGLIKTVSVRGPDARSVQLAIHEAFEDVLRISSNTSSRLGHPSDYPVGEFLGLRQSWVPLRKLHKDSRLRFLTPAEMATPALWNFTFLFSSVVMKATGVQRLYITQPEAYLQDHPLGHHAFEAGWTWQKLRQLSRVYPDSQSSADVPEADALEACWAWDDRLDEPPSVSASTVSLRQSHLQRVSRRSSTEPSSQQFYTGVQSPILSNPSGFVRAQSPLVQRERKGSWPPHLRTGSVPPVSPALLSPAQSRRRVSSHAVSATPYERRSSPFVPARSSPRPSPRLGASVSAPISTGAVPKRRFRTRSPSLAPRNTPRWSRTSMSRSPSLAPGGLYGYHEDQVRGQRHTTPFYYATPHSEAVPEYGYHRAGSRGPPAAMLRTTNGYDPDDDDEEMDDDPYDDDGDEEDMSTDPYDSEMTNDDGHGVHGGHGSGQGKRNKQGRKSNNGSFGFGTTDGEEADFDIDVYQDEEEEDELDGVETDAGGNNIPANTNHHHNNAGGAWSGFGRQIVSSSQPSQQQHLLQHPQQPLRPEDIPWAGIEDAEEDSVMSDGENMDPRHSSFSQGTGDDEDEEEEIPIHEDEPEEDIEIVGDENGDENNGEESGSSQAPSEYSSRRPGAWQIVPASGIASGGSGGGAGTATATATVLAGGSGGSGGGGGQQKQVLLLDQGAAMEFRIPEDGTATGAGRRGGEGLELLDTQWE